MFSPVSWGTQYTDEAYQIDYLKKCTFICMKVATNLDVVYTVGPRSLVQFPYSLLTSGQDFLDTQYF